MIKGIIFDYGGTIDSRGVHWSEVIWQGYEDAKVEVSKEEFRQSYVMAERELAKVRHILPHHNFYDLLLIKMRIELADLVQRQVLPESFDIEANALHIAKYCYDAARQCIEEARPTLEALYARYPMVLVSNFYGNVESVLTDFDVRKYFGTIVESAVVGVRKPDPAIWRMGAEAAGRAPGECIAIGDSFDKDIQAAGAAGCRTVWFKGVEWKTAKRDETLPTHIITALPELLDLEL